MRTQLLFSVFVGIAVAGCGSSEHSDISQNTANLESPQEFIPEELPYHLVKTTDDGSQVIQYCIEVFHPEMHSRTGSDGQDEVFTVMASVTEERIATIPPGEDISKFLREFSGGRIISPESYTPFDRDVDVAPAPAPPALPE